jgi:hypothetical protein
MTRLHPTLALTLAVFAVSATPILTVRAQTNEIIKDSEAYAVYASVVQMGSSTAGKPLTEVALLQETRAGRDCLREEEDKNLQPEWRSVVESFRRENARVRIIREGFDLGVPYSIVTVTQLRKLMRDAGYSKQSPITNTPGADVFARFPSGRLVALSAVGFNAEKTRAIVAMQFDCFPSWTGKEHAVCREGRHIAVEKKDGRWNVVPSVRIGCVWTA